MPLTVLTDADVRSILFSLTRDDVVEMQQSLADALHHYSTNTEGHGCCSTYQPIETALKRKGQTTFFMPASSNDGLGIKIVTRAATDQGGHRNTPPETPSDVSLEPLTFNPTPPDAEPPKPTLTLLTSTGHPHAILPTTSLTPFRTALASTLILQKRTNVHDLTVFGAGQQAYWHIYLALLLRGPEIHHLNILARSFAKIHFLIQKLYKPFDEPIHYSEMGDAIQPGTSTLPRPKIQMLTPAHAEWERLRKNAVRDASCIFCCTTPDVRTGVSLEGEPLFPAKYLTSNEGRRKGRFVVAVGSTRKEHVELDPDIIRENVGLGKDAQDGKPHRHFHKHAQRGGAIIVDSVEACLRDGGEIVQAGLTGREVVEIGELIMLRRDAEERKKMGKSSVQLGDGDEKDERRDAASTKSRDSRKSQERERDAGAAEEEVDTTTSTLESWLRKGNVIYKSVGLGLMDVVIGREIVRIAEARGVGVRVEGF